MDRLFKYPFKRMCKERGLRQDFVAKKIGVAKETFYKWSNLKPSDTLDVGGSYLHKLSQIFDCSIEDLLTDKVAA